ncbi:MAG TPA: DNA-3-methyladenine glycosylase 2 family protein, partial [Chitinophagaceae bacterium]|nr:DNA-3-methyladenine glycosylase 2 family protein [Chitinophagaceae bacterium]
MNKLFSIMHYLPHLSKDKKLKKLLQQSGPFQLKKRNNICLYLCASIISQQLSTKVADVIYQRFLHLYGTKKPTASQIANTSVDKLRSIGLSNAKANYVKN